MKDLISIVRSVEPVVGVGLLLVFLVPLLVQRRVRSTRILFLCLLAYVTVLFRTAWLGDDAFITFRTVEHFVSGAGLVFNVGERVQTFTSPAWMFLLSAIDSVTRELPHTTMVVSIGISATAVWILLTRATAIWQAGLLAGFCLTASKAFVDYSTSGLENPLSFLLLAVFFRLYFVKEGEPRNFRALSLTACLVMLTRLDLGLLVLPALIGCVVQRRDLRSSVTAVLTGFSLLAAWELFSLFYYGFPFPNTAYAKLSTGIPGTELAIQGLRYLRNSLMTDPLTLCAIVVALATSLFRGSRAHLTVAIGILLYMIYAVKIGGDFMAGRHLAAPFFAAVWILARTARPHWAQGATAPVVILAGALLVSPTPTVFSGLWYGAPFSSIGSDSPAPRWAHESGIEDSRYFYMRETGLLRNGVILSGSPKDHWLLEQARRYRALGDERGHLVVVDNGIGILGTLVGDKVHILDPVALADPLLARVPARRDIPWRIGHFERAIPEGYVETLESGQNRLVDPQVAEYYGKLATLVRADLFAPGRLVEIFRFNFGSSRSLIDTSFFVDPPGNEPASEGPRDGRFAPVTRR